MFSAKLRAVSLLALVVAVGCGSSDVPAPPAPAASESPKTFTVTHSNLLLGTPSFAWLSRSDWPRFETAEIAAEAVVKAVAPTFRLRDEALTSLTEPVVHRGGFGPILARATQRIEGIDIFRSGLNIVLSPTFEPVAASGLVASNLARIGRFELEARSALETAHMALTGREAAFVRLDEDNDYERFSSTVVQLAQPARAKHVYYPTKDGLEAAWYVELMLAEGAARSFVISATTDRVLFSNDLVRHDAYSYRVWASTATKVPMDGPQSNSAVPLVVAGRSGFQPTYVSQELVTLQNFPFSKNDPWLLPGATTTAGNNVRAYSDVVRPNGLTANSADTAAATTSASTFDYVYDTGTSAGTTPGAVKAAVTQMFYTTNFLHDWYYDAGFDEKSGNHQSDNFGRGGKARDPLLAETQDYSGRNNANAAVPADGASPRIQMYLFGGPTKASLVVDSPAPNAGTKKVGTAGQFGKDSFTLSGTVALAADPGGVDPNDACESTSSLAGKIAVVHRGNCAFVVKAQNVQAAGAVGVIIVNMADSNEPGTPPFMGGTASDVNIPALSLNFADGKALVNAAASGVTVTMNREASQDLDGALDNGIVSHEWGHVLSGRLIADGNGLNTNQAGGLGEGWGDFSALMLMVREEDALVPANAGWTGVYPSASYTSAVGNDFYFGIRRVPYSTDMTKDPLTFKHISNGIPLPTNVPISFGEDGSFNSEVHNTGEVWATMLWECYASLLSSGHLSFGEAQDRMKRYFVSSLKLTPPSPTLLEARDALLAAAYATDPRDFDLFWKAFAKRGAGVGAVGPAKDSQDNKGVKESFAVGNVASLVSLDFKDDALTCDHDGILDEGEVGTLEVTIRNSGAGTLSETKATFSSRSPNVKFVGGEEVKFDPFKPFESKTAKVKVAIDGVAEPQPVTIDVHVDDPSLLAKSALTIALPVRHAVDEVADSSTVDTVETSATTWRVTGQDRTGGSAKWARVQRGSNHVWFIPNAGEPADHQLTSPMFEVPGNAFTLSWKHRWSFESSVEDKKDYDGGVVEITTDNGKTWEDISVYGDIDYNVKLENDPRTTMVLKGRKAFGHESPGYPDQWVATTVNVTLETSGAQAKVRFRHGADDNSASVGWEIDDISVVGLSAAPFGSFVPQRDECDANGPTAIAPPGQTTVPETHVTLVGTGTHPKGLPLGFSWHQSGGPPVSLSGQATATLEFESPAVTEPATLTFSLRANDGSLVSAPSRVDVVVTPLSFDAGGGGCNQCRKSFGSGAMGLGIGAFALVAWRRRRSAANRPSKPN